MAFRATQETLEALEWPSLVARLRGACRTIQGMQWVDSAVAASAAPLDDSAQVGTGRALFAADLAELRERLAETGEARTLLDADSPAPLGETADVRPVLERAAKGALLEIEALRDVGRAIDVLQRLRTHLERHGEAAPRLADRASLIEDHGGLARELERCIDPSGEIRDGASSSLAAARRDAQRLAAELQRSLGRYLQDAGIADALSDRYFTVRNDRYVLPVKADHKGKVRGIVHDASRSGTTLFVEPEGVVDLNNRLKEAELSVAREIDRILRRLSASVGESARPVQSGLDALAAIDVAFARGRLSVAMDGIEPEVGDAGVLRLPGLRHPLIPPELCVPNDVELGERFRVLVVSGPNAGGKTVVMKATALAALLLRAGLHVPCAPGARVDLIEQVVADIGDGQDIGESLSTFSAHMAGLARIVRSADRHALVLLDEVGVGTDPSEGAALAQSILERLADADARVVATTHYNLLKEMADVDPRFSNACVAFDPETLAPTYRLELGAAGASSALAVAARMGMPSEVLARTEALLAREDRQLDRMLTELAASRATLERERQRMSDLRAETEATRDAYRSKLERIQTRRDALFAEMRGDLDRAFKSAHAEVAGVIRDLQRGPTAQQAARAREKLLALESASPAPVDAPPGPASRAPAHAAPPVDWRRARPGDPVQVDGRRAGVLLSLPDRKGRAGVRVGGAKLILPAERVRVGVPTAGPAAAAPSAPRITHPERAAGETLGGGTLRCDLRGLRVEEAIDRLAAALDEAAADGRDEVCVIHGHGSGALREAVRAHLRSAPLVARLRPGNEDEGGEGVTLAEIG